MKIRSVPWQANIKSAWHNGAQAPLKEEPKSSATRKYKLKWLKDTKAFKCYGCDCAIRVPGEISDPPNDVIASTKEYKSFMKDGKLQSSFSGPRITIYVLHALLPRIPNLTQVVTC